MRRWSVILIFFLLSNSFQIFKNIPHLLHSTIMHATATLYYIGAVICVSEIFTYIEIHCLVTIFCMCVCVWQCVVDRLGHIFVIWPVRFSKRLNDGPIGLEVFYCLQTRRKSRKHIFYEVAPRFLHLDDGLFSLVGNCYKNRKKK